MREPALDHGQTWEDFYRERARRVAELEVAYGSLRLWEREEARRELDRLRYELDYSGGMIEGDTEEQSMASV